MNQIGLKFVPKERERQHSMGKKSPLPTGERVSFLTTKEIFDGMFRRSIEIVDANPFDGLTPSNVDSLFWRVNLKKKKKKNFEPLFFLRTSLLLQPWQQSVFSVYVEQFYARSNRTNIRHKEDESNETIQMRPRYVMSNPGSPSNNRTTNSTGSVSPVWWISPRRSLNRVSTDHSIINPTIVPILPMKIDWTDDFWIRVRYASPNYRHIRKSTTLVLGRYENRLYSDRPTFDWLASNSGAQLELLELNDSTMCNVSRSLRMHW